MNQAIAVALGGAAGAVARWLVSVRVGAWFGSAFPWATLAVNAVGSFAIGIAAVICTERLGVGPVGRAGIVVGLLGGFTTFSTFALETLQLGQAGFPWRGAVYAAISVITCVAAAGGGVHLARAVAP